MVGGNKYTRQVQIGTDRFSIDATIVVEDFVDSPEGLADDLQNTVDDALIDFVVFENTD